MILRSLRRVRRMGYHPLMIRIVFVGILASVIGFAVISPAASATPNVVDQYTEQVPTPGGNKPSNHVVNGSQNNSDDQGGGGNRGTGGGTGGGSSDSTSTAYSGSPDSGVTSAGAGAGSKGGSGSNAGGNDFTGDQGRPGGSGKTQASGSGAGSSGATPAQLNQTGLATPESSGMGWTFPAILIVSVLVIVGFTLTRRFSSKSVAAP